MKRCLLLFLTFLSFPLLAEEKGALSSGAGEASGFLETDFEPLAIWFDERFDIKFRAMTPGLVFEQVPLNDVFFETSNLPVEAPEFNFTSNHISRRELLREIADYWSLDLSFSFGADGNPNAIIVEGRNSETQ